MTAADLEIKAPSISKALKAAELDYGGNFLEGAMTNLFAASGVKGLGSAVESIESSAFDTISQGVNVVRDITNGASNMISETIGTGMGLATGIVGKGEEMIRLSMDLPQLIIDDMTSYTMELVSYITDFASSMLLAFPQDIAAYTAAVAGEKIKTHAEEAMKALTIDQDEAATNFADLSISETIGAATQKISEGMNWVNGQLNEYLGKATEWAGQVTYYMNYGEEFVLGYINEYEDIAKSWMSGIVHTYMDIANDWRNKTVESLGTQWGNTIADKTNKALDKTVKEAADAAAKKIAAAKIKAKILIKKALFSVMAQLGG